MGWKLGKYYERTVRVGDRTTKRYYGAGLAGAIVAAMDEEWRVEQEQARRERRERDEAERQALEAERSRGESIKELVATGLSAMGFQRHDRGRWRRRRMGTVETLPATVDEVAVKAEMETAIAKIGRGRDPLAVETLRRLARAHPKLAARAIGGDLARLTREALANLINGTKAGKDRRLGDPILARIEVMTAELAGDEPGEAELMVAECAAFAYVEYWTLTLCTAAHFESAESLNKMRRRDAAHKRLMASLKTLAQIAALERRESSASPSPFASLFNQRGIENGHDLR